MTRVGDARGERLAQGVRRSPARPAHQHHRLAGRELRASKRDIGRLTAPGIWPEAEFVRLAHVDQRRRQPLASLAELIVGDGRAVGGGGPSENGFQTIRGSFAPS